MELQEAIKTGERIYKFTECKSSEDCKDIYLVESELQDKHKNHLLGEIIIQYDRLPKDRLEKFNEYINKSEPTLEEAIKVLQKHLREDKAFYSKWKEKIGDSFWDIVIMEPAHFADEYNFKEISENAAKNFLDNLIKE
jgi:hypothetical protein